MTSRKRFASEPTQLSLERLESRILLAVFNPGDAAILHDGDRFYYVQGETSDAPNDIGGDGIEDWVIIVSFFGPGEARLYNWYDQNTLNLTEGGAYGDKLHEVLFLGTNETSSLFIQRGRFTNDYSLSDWAALPLSAITELDTDTTTGRYIWGNTGIVTPWMMTIVTTDYFAPTASNAAVVTGNVYFDSSCTGFGLFALDGSLKGTVTGVDQDETLRELRLGYLHGPGGVDIEGNIDRMVVRTTVAQIQDTAVDRPALTDRQEPANIYVGGHLMELQSSGSLFANITVDGNSARSPVFDLDLRAAYGVANNPALSGGEFYTLDYGAGFLNDNPDSAFIVGSPTGDFTIQGNVTWSFGAPSGDKWDLQDWYTFNAGMGRQVTVEMEDLGTRWAYTWVIAPSGRVVGVATPDEPVSFLSQEGGNYYLMVGRVVDDERLVQTEGSEDYVVNVTGALPVVLGGVRAGSNIFNQNGFNSPVEFGDDVSPTSVYVGGSLGSLESLGPNQVLGATGGATDLPRGLFGNVVVYTLGDAGYISGGTTVSTGYMSPPAFDIGGNLGRLEMHDPAGALVFNYIYVDGNVGEIDVAGSLGLAGAAPIDVGGHVGSVRAGADFNAQMTVHQDGLDSFYVGGNFGSPGIRSRLDMEYGTDVAFAYVGGSIYSAGLLVPNVTVTGQSTTFTDDGGSLITLTPLATRSKVFAGLRRASVPGTLSYRYLPIGRPGTGPVGAVLTEVSVNDALAVSVSGGQADLPYVRFNASLVPGVLGMPTFSLTLSSPDPLAEVDVYFVDVVGGLGAISSIVNRTHQGDILNVYAASVGTIFADGDIGLTEQYAPEDGRLLNGTPATFGPPNTAALYSVFQDRLLANSSAGSFNELFTRHFNGVVVTGSIARIEANGSIGDVYVGGIIGTYRPNADDVDNGTRFDFKGIERDARSWDGMAGVVYAGFGILTADVGDGTYGGHGGLPIGGMFTGGTINTLTASDALIEGPIFGLTGINRFIGVRTMIHDASIGAGASFSDWALWDEARVTTQSVRLVQLSLTGPGSGIDQSTIQVGVLQQLTLGAGTNGFVDSQVWAVGNPVTNEGIVRMDILGGNLDGTGAPAYDGLGRYDDLARLMDLVSNQNIATVAVGNGGDMINMDVMSLKNIGTISVRNDIVADTSTVISAPQRISLIQADNILAFGAGGIDIATGRLEQLRTGHDLRADVNVDGSVGRMLIGGTYDADMTISGPNGSVDNLTVTLDLMGSLRVGNYIGTIDVLTGDIDADIAAGGANVLNQAIGTIRVRNGSLDGDVGTYVNLATLRPGGGIGTIDVRGGSVSGSIAATSYYDPIRGNSVTANIGLINVVNGDLDGDVTIQRNSPADPRDPGGNLLKLSVTNGDLNGDVTVRGDIGSVIVKGGSINGAITVLGSDVNTIRVTAYGSPAISGDIFIDGDLVSMIVSGGPVDGSLTVGGTLGQFQSSGIVLQPIQAGDIGRLTLLGGTGPGGSITSASGLDLLSSRGDLSGDLSIAGDAGPITITGGDLNADLDVGGSLTRLDVQSGGVTSNGNPAEPRISVGGDLPLLRVYGYSGIGIAIDDDVTVGGSLASFEVRNGDFEGTLQAGTIGTATYRTPSGVTQPIISNGNLNTLTVALGPIDAPITVYHHIGTIQALHGVTASGDITVGSGFAGSGLDSLVVRGGNLAGDLAVTGTLSRVNVTGNVIGSQIEVDGGLGQLSVSGSLLGTDVAVSGALTTATVTGNYTDTSINAGTLGRVSIRGAVSSPTPPDDMIHAGTGSFTLSVAGTTYHIDLFNDAWFDSGKVHAYVG
jgi:hypothetical protein